MLTALSRRVRPTGLALAATLSTALGACVDRTSTAPSREPAARSALTKSLPGGRGRILFSSAITGDEEIFSIREDGTEMTRVTYSPGLDRQAVFSPDGRKIAFVSTRGSMAHQSIFVMNADGTNVKRLIADSTFTLIDGLAWSPDGKQIAFGASVGPSLVQYDLYLMSSSGAQLKQLTNTENIHESQPTFKPTGDRIAFRSYTLPSGPLDIWTIAVDGSDPQIRIACPIGCSGPAWAPDGRYIAFTTAATANNPTEVQTVDLMGGNASPLTVATDAAYAAWSPDGVKLVYRKFVGGTYQVATSAADGTGLAVLTGFTSASLPTSWGR